MNKNIEKYDLKLFNLTKNKKIRKKYFYSVLEICKNVRTSI